MTMKPSMSIVVLFLELLALATINICFCNRNTHLNCIESEREALLRFKHDLKDPSNRLVSWSGDGECCAWTGVICDNLTGHVVELHLEHMEGKINPSLLDLKDLIYLNLSNNAFEGIQIPKFLGSMRKLKYLDLSRAGFMGMIPHQLGNLSDLTYLDLYTSGSWNGLYVDSFFWLSNLRSLEHLDLSYVSLNKTTDWLQVINDLPLLDVLILYGCQLHHFPPIPIANFSSLTILDLTYNQLGPSIPSWIFGLKDLIFLSLSSNSFEGLIPDGLQNLTSLRSFDLSYNFFNSSIPNWLYKFSHLEYLLLDAQCRSDRLEGRIPRSFETLCKLKSISLFCVKLNQNISEVLDIFSRCASNGLELLDLRQSQLFGHLSDQLGKFKNLVKLSLSYNSISGPIPLSLGELSSLNSLSLSFNKFNGIISEMHFSKLTRLFYFDVSGNSLKLKVSANWIPPFQLVLLGLGSCHLGPRFPLWLYSQQNIGILDISSSGISDTISSKMWEFLSQVHFLNLSHNQFHGEIPNLTEVAYISSIYLNSNNLSGRLPIISSKITELDLSDNNLSGSIFKFLCCGKNKESKQTVSLNLKNNFLSGQLPNCWMNWQNLEFLNLDNNNFTGSLPTSIGTLGSLRLLHLRKNSLSGTIPASLKTYKLEVLDVGENAFVGKIPIWIGDRFSRIVILNLRSNNFHGVLPIEFCHLSSLQVLDLAYNNLSGNIPRCFNNFTAMVTMNYTTQLFSVEKANQYLVMKGKMDEYSSILDLVRIIDLSRNNFFGEIPIEVTNLKALQTLNLSHNFLTGRIPRTIGAMTSIESLDFSRNQLFGQIPSSISNLYFLSHLNISNNNLTGRIPLSTQLQSFDASCFAGNKLCGDPLPKKCGTTTDSMPNHEERGEDRDEHEVNWFYVSMPIGFVVGFWGVIGPLIVNRRWRYNYCHFLDHLGNKLYFFVRKCC